MRPRVERVLAVYRTASVVVAWALLAAMLPQSALGQFRDPDILIEPDSFGLASYYRPGEVVPMRLRLTNNPAGSLDDAVSVWVQWEVPDADGDIAAYGRPVTLTRGRPTPLWLYAPPSPSTGREDIWAVRIFDWRDGQRRAEIGGRRLSPSSFGSSAVPVNVSQIAILGQRRLGLPAYGNIQAGALPSTYESTHILSSIRPEDLPDRWEPLMAYEAIVWGDGQPQALTSDVARALIDYVRWGGHLIIVLQEEGSSWQFSTRGRTPLDAILPTRDPRRDAGVPVTDILPVLSKARGLSSSVSDNITFNLSVFKDLHGDFNAIEHPYEPLIALPDGRVVVIQRSLGFGRVTITGVDVSQLRLASIRLSSETDGMPEADVFWNRILGRRVDTPHPRVVDDLEKADLLFSSRPATPTVVGSGAMVLTYIAIETQAGLGLMLALLLFAVYWVLAGPGGFALLRLYKKSHHAWIAFALAAGAFTAIAWGSVGLIRVNEPEIRHLTFLDHIARPDGIMRPEDPQLQRAISWFSLYTPGYTRTQIAIDPGSDERNILLPWTPPDEPQRPFPNADRYTVNVADSAASFDIPSRSTATHMHARWMGGLDPDWGGMIRTADGQPLQVDLDGSGREAGLRGRLTHGFADSLKDVTVIWVRNSRLTPRRYAVRDGIEQQWMPPTMSGQMLNSGFMWRVGSWAPGEVLDLSDRAFSTLGSDILSTNITRRYVDQYSSRTLTATQRMSPSDLRNYMEMLSIFQQLTPPEYLKTSTQQREQSREANFHRRLGRELDLSPWFTRPCLIIMGFLEGESETPVPVRLGSNGSRPRSYGTTVVRWIYPLPLIEEIAFDWPERFDAGGSETEGDNDDG